MTPLNAANWLEGSMKNAGTKWILPSMSGCCVYAARHPSAGVAAPNVHLSPANVDTNARPPTWSWFVRVATASVSARIGSASLADAQVNVLCVRV